MLMLMWRLICELDEQWSFVGSKARQHWLWYGVMPLIS
ncbi:Transposase [Shigella dysenteriae 1617]|uniref:Transposase n=1 Tax=Shigella dysenteriae 1617 TaxID=754093 RepID=A0A0A6ZU16_SHIDY|nr:Transposase [Shigella dysenteriae 1617]